ncbi:MAG: MATE family efflux transporter [Clostridia bacterium]|nr:MATE family efflux transporter [Clostridia bacterium]
MTNTKIRDFTEGNISKQLVSFAWPLLFSNILQVVYSMADMIIVGNVMGKVGTSAVAVGGDVTNLLTFVGIGFASAGQVLIARYIGAGERQKIGRFVGTMAGFLFVCAVFSSVLGLIFQKPLLTVMNTPAEAFAGAEAYSTICILGLVFIYGYNIVSAILRGMGDSKHPLLFIGIAVSMNVILDILFVAVFKMGAGGAALATVISQATSFLLCLGFLVKKRREFEMDIHRGDFIRWNSEMLSAFVKLGTPMAIKFASVQVSKLFVNSWINSYGVAVSAFAGIANKLAMVVNLFSNAMNTAGSTLVGQNLVAGKFDRVKKILKNIFFITITIVLIFSVLICIFPEEIFGLFIDDAEGDVLALARGYVPIALLMFLASSLRATMNALINGSGSTKINFATAILDGIVLRIGLALLFGVVFDMKHTGFWLGDALAGFTPFWLGIIFYFSGSWKKAAKPRTAK